MVESTESSSFLGPLLGNLVLDVYIGKALCNEKCKHGFFGGSFYSISIILQEGNYLLHPTSSGFESRAIHYQSYGKYEKIFVIG